MTRLAGLQLSFPTITSPFRWIGRSRRRMRIAGLILLAMVVGPPLWWKLQLTGLPDIGDPFDVKAFRASTIPDDHNAYVLFHRAANLFKPWQPGTKAPGNMLVPWSVAMPELRLWVEVNREALAVYRQASERPDALGAIPEFHGYHDELWGMGGPLNLFKAMALLEGSRLEELGDMEGAWGWYRAILRTIHLVGLHGTVFRRSSAQQWHNELFIRLKDWSFDSRTTPALLRRALDDVIACESLAPSESYLLKAEYLDVERLLDLEDGPTRTPPNSWWVLIPAYDIGLTPEWTESIYNRWRTWRREPERSRRAMRLAIAHWLAYYETTPANRPKVAPDRWLKFEFYPVGPEVPVDARRLSPRSLASWLDSTIDANFLFGSWGWAGVRMTERANHRALLILLAEELYRRDHGTDPPSPEALVGPYLKSLPDPVDDGSDQANPRAGKAVE
jgi:hypothetical protein